MGLPSGVSNGWSHCCFILYKKNNVLVCPDSPHDLQMEFIHVVDHTHTECDDNSHIHTVIFCFCSSH